MATEPSPTGDADQQGRDPGFVLHAHNLVVTYHRAMSATPRCPDCGQPASTALAGPEHGWECRNEGCPEFGQSVRPDEPEATEPSPTGDAGPG